MLSRKRPATLLLHVSLMLILAGGLLTLLFGQRGSVHLRTGETVSEFALKDGRLAAFPFGLRLESFHIEFDPGSRRPADYVSVVSFLTAGDSGSSSGMTKKGTGESPATISMNHIGKYRGYRFCQADYDADGAGSILSVNHDPWGVGVTYAGYLLLLLAMVGFFFERESAWRRTLRSLRPGGASGRRRSPWPVLIPAAGAALLVLWLLRTVPRGPLLPVLRTPLLFIHMIPIIVSYALFSLLAILGVVGLLLPEGKSARLRDVSRVLLLPAVFLLAFGTFLGAVWANISWGSYWTWDPKETWALITLLVYAAVLHGTSLRPSERPRLFHLLCLLAFLTVLATFFGVNLIFGGIHSYA